MTKINWKNGLFRLLMVTVILWYVGFAVPIVTTHLDHFGDFSDNLRWASIEEQHRAEVASKVVSQCAMPDSERAAQRQLVTSLCRQRAELRDHLVASSGATRGTPSDAEAFAANSAIAKNSLSISFDPVWGCRAIRESSRRGGVSSQQDSPSGQYFIEPVDELVEAIRLSPEEFRRRAVERRELAAERLRVNLEAGVASHPGIRDLDQQLRNALQNGDGTIPAYCTSAQQLDQVIAARLSLARDDLERRKPSTAAVEAYVTWVILPLLIPIVFLIVLFVFLTIGRWVFAGFVAK